MDPWEVGEVKHVCSLLGEQVDGGEMQRGRWCYVRGGSRVTSLPVRMGGGVGWRWQKCLEEVAGPPWASGKRLPSDWVCVFTSTLRSPDSGAS